MSTDPAVAYCAELRLKVMGIICTGKLCCGRSGGFYHHTTTDGTYRCGLGQNHYPYEKKSSHIWRTYSSQKGESLSNKKMLFYPFSHAVIRCEHCWVKFFHVEEPIRQILSQGQLFIKNPCFVCSTNKTILKEY